MLPARRMRARVGHRRTEEIQNVTAVGGAVAFGDYRDGSAGGAESVLKAWPRMPKDARREARSWEVVGCPRPNHDPVEGLC